MKRQHKNRNREIHHVRNFGKLVGIDHDTSGKLNNYGGISNGRKIGKLLRLKKVVRNRPVTEWKKSL